MNLKITILFLTIVICFLYLILSIQPNGNPGIVKFLILSQIIFSIYLGILFLSKKINLSINKDKTIFFLIILIAVITQIGVSYFSDEQTYLSDDVYRYVWEGKILYSGYSPYLFSPNDFENTALADSSIYPKINHPWLPTIYPPLSQFFFVVAYLIDNDGVYGFKILSLFFELMSLILILLFIKTAKLPDWTFLIYLLSPLIFIEFLFSNHIDILALPFFLFSLIFLLQTKPRPVVVGITLGLGIVVKLYLLFFAPFIFFYFKSANRIRFTISTIITTLLFYLPFIIISGLDIFGSLGTYLTDWQYNGSIFILLKQFVPIMTAKVICLILFMIGIVILLIHSKLRGRVILQMFSVFGLFVILSPMIFNWYLVWLLPFIIYYRNIPFLVLTGVSIVSYHVLIGYYENGTWSEYSLLKIWNYLPFYLILLYMTIMKFKQNKLSWL